MTQKSHLRSLYPLLLCGAICSGQVHAQNTAAADISATLKEIKPSAPTASWPDSGQSNKLSPNYTATITAPVLGTEVINGVTWTLKSGPTPNNTCGDPNVLWSGSGTTFSITNTSADATTANMKLTCVWSSDAKPSGGKGKGKGNKDKSGKANATLQLLDSVVDWEFDRRCQLADDLEQIDFSVTITDSNGFTSDKWISPEFTVANPGCTITNSGGHGTVSAIAVSKSALKSKVTIKYDDGSPEERTSSEKIMFFKIETVTEAVLPTNWSRRKLGVREKSEVTVTPSSSGTINWSLINQKDATVNPATGNTVMFQADTRTKDTTLRATFDTGETYDILWNVVQPTGERARKTADLNYAAGTQGAGMTLEYTTLPDDVSFYQVEVLEVDKGTSNVTGFFTLFPAVELQHTPNPIWVRLDQENHWVDTPEFFGWGFPPSSGHTRSWRYGTYQWAIDVMWKTAGEVGNGLLLGTRTQLHTLHDGTGRSTESKSGESSPRTP